MRLGARKFVSEIWIEKELPQHSYLSKIPSVRWLAGGNTLKFSKNVTFIVGDNGTGKSTIIEALAVGFGFNPEGGTLNYSFSTQDTHSELCDYLTIAKKAYPKNGYFLRAETLYNAATYQREIFHNEIAAGIREDLHNMSHGESFLKTVEGLRGNGIYIFDEPEAALSPRKLLSLMYHINELSKKGSQFIIATHSPILMAFPGAEIFLLDEDGIDAVEYTDTEHYLVTKSFLDNPERTLARLFE